MAWRDYDSEEILDLMMTAEPEYDALRSKRDADTSQQIRALIASDSAAQERLDWQHTAHYWHDRYCSEKRTNTQLIRIVYGVSLTCAAWAVAAYMLWRRG